MAKDIGSYFLEQGQPIVPKAKPKQYTIAKEKSQTEEVLDILNTKAAATMLSPRTYTNLVGQTARKAYDQQDISASDYYDIVMPLFGETGEMVTEKIRQYDAELDRYADGGRVNFDKGSPGKKGGNYNPSGKNQFTGKMKSIEQIKLIQKNNPTFRPKDFRGEGKLNNPELKKDFKGKLLTKDDILRGKAAGIVFPTGKIKFKDTRGDQNLKASQFYKASQGSAMSMDKINNFAHFAPKLKSYLTSTQDTGPLKANVNRAAEGYDKEAKKIALKQEKLIQEKPKNWRLKLDAANAEARKASIKANKTLAKENKNLKGTLGYFVVNPNTGEFKLKGVDRAKTFAGISGEKQEYKKMDPSKRAAFGPTQSKVQGIMDLIKSKVKGADIKRASNAPIPQKTLTANMFKGAFKGMPGGGSGKFKDPLGGPDLIDVKQFDRNPDNDF
jgi:hypothetical protein